MVERSLPIENCHHRFLYVSLTRRMILTLSFSCKNHYTSGQRMHNQALTCSRWSVSGRFGSGPSQIHSGWNHVAKLDELVNILDSMEQG